MYKPWLLSVGSCSWIGENVIIDNPERVLIGNNVCISQSVYISSGNHDYKSFGFDLMNGRIEIRDHSWLCATSRVGPGVVVADGAVLLMASLATLDLLPWTVYMGIPASPIRQRVQPPVSRIHNPIIQ